MTKKRGFSYIEVLIAVSVMAVVLTAVLPMIFASISRNRDTRLRLIAYESALNEVEKLRESKVPSLCPNPLPQSVPCEENFTVATIPGSVGKVSIIKNLGDQKIANVDVTIDWNFKGHARKAEIHTYLYGSIE